ncbi:MAG: redoxin domain-containing protein [Anaerolineales bacterium]
MDTVIPNHQPAPDFSLPDLSGRSRTLKELTGRMVILNFWSAECPHAARIDRALAAYMSEWDERVVLLSIASNANETLQQIAQAAHERQLTSVLRDADHHVADLYGALTTPHLFVIDAGGILRYQGAFDDVTFRQRTPSKSYLRQAVEAVLAGRQPDPEQTPPYGCSIVRYKL